LYAKAIAEFDAAGRSFQKLAERVEVVKVEKAQLQEVLEALRVAKAERRTVVSGTPEAAQYSEARALEVAARHADSRPEAIALLRRALARYQGELEPALEDAAASEESTRIMPAAEVTAPAAAPPADTQRTDTAAMERTMPVHPIDVAAETPGSTAGRTLPEATVEAVDVTMPARGPVVAHARIPQPISRDATPGAEAPVPVPDTQVLLVPDEYPRIQAAIDAARAGATVRIRPGVYDENLVLKNGVKVIGENRKTVIVRAPIGQSSVVFAKNCRTGLLSGVTLEHGASRGGDPRYAGIKLHNSSLGIFRCIVQRTAGSGVIVKSGGTPTIRECVIQDNPGPGIYVRGTDTSPLIKGNICVRNSGRGIYFDSGSTGRAIENECRENLGSGIAVHDAGTAPEVSQNTCSQNTEYGMYFGRGAGGVAEDNTCSHNGISGISIHDAGTEPTLRRNTCVENKNDGMYFGDASSGVADGNTCTRNGEDGIFVRDPGTSPKLSGNHCLGNMLRGIEFGFGAHGVAETNRCEQNAREGIRVSNVGTTPLLRENECIDNGTRGIYFSKGAGGCADGNVCEGNKECGIGVANAGTSPLVRRNRIQRNVQYGIMIDREASPTLDGNQWAHNGIADLNDDRPV
jgi:parallel beta-helix repeat protein